MVLYLLLFTLAPIIQVFIISLSDSLAPGLTLSHYLTLLAQREFHHAFFNTLFIALGSLALEIDAFRIFSLALILMGENLEVIGTYAYLEYAEYNNPYLSAASAVILFLMIMGAVALYIKAVGKKGVQAA